MPGRRAIGMVLSGLVSAAGLSGCATARHYVVRPVIALVQFTDAQDRIFTDLVRADGDGDGEPGKWNFDIPHRLRPCCAFGSGLGVRVGYLPIAGLKVDNIVDLSNLGRHEYNSGIVSLSNEPSNAFVSTEFNGLIYTCRGGFIDTAHVRDYADWMVYLVGRIREMVDEGGTIHLPNEGGDRYLHIGVIKPSIIENVGREEVAIRLAQWAAIHLAIWHETATWYGWSSWGIFPETASAFSPEDLYSNLVGIMLATELVHEGLADNADQYNTAMNVAMPEVLRRLAAAPVDVTRAALRSVDGKWWDSRRMLPDKEVVLRRSFDIGPEISPWKSPMGRSVDDRTVRDFCDGRRSVPLSYETHVDGEPLHYMVRLEVQPDGRLSHLLALHNPDGPWVSQENFPDIVQRARLENRLEFGDDADHP